MKANLFFLLLAFCVLRGEPVIVFADPTPLTDRQFAQFLQSVSGDHLINAPEVEVTRATISEIVEEIQKKGEMSALSRDKLSMAVIKHSQFLKSLKITEAFAHRNLRSACIILNRRLTDDLFFEICVSREKVKEAHKTILELETAQDGKDGKFPDEIMVFGDLKEACHFALLALDEEEAECAVSTYHIHMIWKVANYMEGAGWPNASQALHIAAAKAARKLKIFED